MPAIDRPLLTSELQDAASFRPQPNSVYVFGTRPEDRTLHNHGWREHAINLDFVEVEAQGTDAILILTEGARRVTLRDGSDLRSVFAGRETRTHYLDITGLSNHVWPALLKIAIELGISVNVLYVEPRDYAYSATPRENLFFDLSEVIAGISPIAQFGRLQEPDESDVTLVALLGFEGARFAHLLEDVQPQGDNVIPVIGVPGFRAEYPFFAYQGNQMPLKSSGAYRNVRFAKANCPFSLFYCLDDLVADQSSKQFFKIGLIGTKPHALGAVLYNIVKPRRVELVYDHTAQRPNRSQGLSRFLIYPVSQFLDSISSSDRTLL